MQFSSSAVESLSLNTASSLMAKIVFMSAALFLAVVCLVVVVDSKFDSLRMSGEPWNQNFTTAAERDQQLECLALNVYREAGHEPFEGKVAVAQVTLNRAESGSFPNEICQVVYQKNVVYQRVVCQFSWYCDSVHRSRPINPAAYQESMIAAKRVLLENYRLPSLETALYYHADYVNPNWRLQKLTKIGRHIFYAPREKGI
jgi:spore germination cell wall hydrolase CwlJ-like protein